MILLDDEVLVWDIIDTLLLLIIMMLLQRQYQ